MSLQGIYSSLSWRWMVASTALRLTHIWFPCRKADSPCYSRWQALDYRTLVSFSVALCVRACVHVMHVYVCTHVCVYFRKFFAVIWERRETVLTCRGRISEILNSKPLKPSKTEGVSWKVLRRPISYNYLLWFLHEQKRLERLGCFSQQMEF